jgi:replicative DNA helicase
MRRDISITTTIAPGNGYSSSAGDASLQKLSPQAIEAEQSVLGSILIDADAILKVADFLRPVDFYRKQHGDIYEAMLALHGQREPIDLVTLGDELERNGRLEPAGGPAYLTTLMNTVPTAVHVEHYGRIVERKAVLRNLIGAAGKIAAVGYEEANDAEVAIDRAESILFEISQHPSTGRSAASSRWRRSSGRPTTGSNTCTSIGARSWASRPASRSWMRCWADSSRPT